MELEDRVAERTAELSVAKAKAESAVLARDRFFSIASHELKTPISSLKLQTQIRRRMIAKGDFSDFAPDRLPELCEDDERQISRLSFLVDNMLDISKVTSGNFEIYPNLTDLSGVVEGSIRQMAPLLKQSGNSLTFTTDGAVEGTWDTHRIEQVVINLLSNASKYAPGKPIEVTVSADENCARVSVRDFGRGIAAADQERIFQPFQRVKNSGDVSGLGLGLYIIKQIVEAHQGTIWVESTIGQGSRFVFEIPRDTQAPVSENP